MTEQIAGLENARATHLPAMHLYKYYFVQQESHTKEFY